MNNEKTIKERIASLQDAIKKLRNSCTHQNISSTHTERKSPYDDYWNGGSEAEPVTKITCNECGKKWTKVGRRLTAAGVRRYVDSLTITKNKVS